MARPSYFRVAALASAVWLLSTGFSFAQPAELPASFQSKLQQMGADLHRPADSDYKALPLDSAGFQPCDFAWYSRREKLEIRYLAFPWQENNSATHYPHIQGARMTAHVAANGEDAHTTVLSLRDEELRAFRADWGAVWFFQPKDVFSERRHGALLVLFREGRGTVMVCFLFDDADNRALDLRFQALSFTE